MPTKTGMGGHAPEAYDPDTGKFIEDGQPNVRHDNPNEANKIKNHIPTEKIQEQSASKQTNPIPNLGKYGKPRSEKDQILKNEFGIKKEEEDDSGFAPTLDSHWIEERFYDIFPNSHEAQNATEIFDQRSGKFLRDFVKMMLPKIDDERLDKIEKKREVPYYILDEMGFKNEDEFDKEFLEYALDPMHY